MVHNLDVVKTGENYKCSSTGYRGIIARANGKFQTTIRISGRRKTVGTFGTAIEAAVAYDQAAIKAGGKVKNRRLNFLDGLPIKEAKKESEIKDGGYLVAGFIIQPYLLPPPNTKSVARPTRTKNIQIQDHKD